MLTVIMGLAYWIGLAACSRLAQQGTMKPEVALWIPDEVFALLGLAMIVRLEKPGDRDVVGRLLALVKLIRPQQRGVRVLDRIGPRAWAARIPLMPQIIDTYVLTSFLFYFVLLVTSFVLIFHVFTFFELLSDIIKNQKMDRVPSYHFFLTPRLIYDFTPISVLAAVLVGFGVLSKHNEITAFKACGISVYRLTVPVLAAGLVLSAGLFAFDHYWVPDADRRQDALRNRDQGQSPADLSPAGSQVDLRYPRPDLLLQIFRPGSERDDGRECVRDRSGVFPIEASHHGGARPLGAGAQHLGISERPPLGYGPALQ